MTDVVNWGVLGGANFAARVMAPAIHEAKGARLGRAGHVKRGKGGAIHRLLPRYRGA